MLHSYSYRLIHIYSNTLINDQINFVRVINSPDLFKNIVDVDNKVEMKKCKVEFELSTLIGTCGINGSTYVHPILYQYDSGRTKSQKNEIYFTSKFVYVTRPAKINHVSVNYTELYLHYYCPF